MATRAEYSARPGRESLMKRLGNIGLQIRARSDFTCAWCHTHEADSMAKGGAKFHLDHIDPEPKKRGIDDPSNLTVACKRCNDAKQNMALGEWLHYAKEKIGLRIDIKQVLATAATKLPSVDESKQKFAQLHERIAADHRAEGGRMHQKAAEANDAAAEHFREGGTWSSKVASTAREASTKAWSATGLAKAKAIIARAMQRGPRGGTYKLTGSGGRDYSKS